MLVLSVIQGPDKGKKFELPAHEPQLIGRSSEALPISDTTVSRRHAELTPDDGLWYIRDIQSQNGTYVNGVRISERCRLRPGDQIRCGGSLFVFGVTDTKDPDVVRFVGSDQVDSTVEKSLRPLDYTSLDSGDSVMLAEPSEPRASAVDHLRVIYRLTTLLTRGVSDQDELLSDVLELVFEEFRPQRGFIVTLDVNNEPKTAAVKYAVPPKDILESRIKVSRTILQHVTKTGEGVLSTNAMKDPRFAAGDSVQSLHIRSAICAPIKFRDRMFGAIYIDTSLVNVAFTPGQLSLLNAIGQHTGLALANQELNAHQVHAERLAAIGETVASLSHSIKNILQGLHGGADVVEMGLKKEDFKIARGGWEILKRNLDRIMSLAMNMLAFSRQRQVEVELLKLGPLFDECAQLLEGTCRSRGVALLSDIDADVPPIPLDEALMHQALLNLLTNAVEAVPQNDGVVTVRASYHTGPAAQALMPGTVHTAVVQIWVIDNGPGIPAEKQQWIFDPFNSTKGLKGTGLGLAVARRIAEEHGGKIMIESRGTRYVAGKTGRPTPISDGPEVGAIFKLVLPADTALDPSATAQAREKSGQEKLDPNLTKKMRPNP